MDMNQIAESDLSPLSPIFLCGLLEKEKKYRIFAFDVIGITHLICLYFLCRKILMSSDIKGKIILMK